MKLPNILFVFLIFTMFPLLAAAGNAENRNDGQGELNSSFGLQGWFSQADANWQISFPYTTKAGTTGRLESELKFKKINSPIIILTGGGKIASPWSFDILYGSGSITGGEGTDIDRFLPSTGTELAFSRSKNDLTGDVRLWGINLYINNKRYCDAKIGHWGVLIGYLHYGDNLTMNNGSQAESLPFDGIQPPDAGNTIPGLDSTYSFSWDAVKSGVLYQNSLTKGFYYAGTLALYPFVNYQGKGYWNLRTTGPDAFRMGSPNFVQTSSTGYGYEASLGLSYKISNNVELSAGYRYLQLYAENGTDTVYFADGTEASSKLDWVTVTRQGAYAEALLKF